jgi:tetratricopeptide (TPR) repeat protein
MRKLCVVGLVAAALSSSLPALASDPTPEDIATARTLGEEGQAALDAKDYAKAEDRFQRAYKLYPFAVTLTLGLARAQAGNGKLVAAQEGYHAIIREALAPGAPEAFKNAVEAAKNELGAVSSRIAGVTINVSGCDHPKVTLDDSPVSDAALGVKRSIDPGAHVVRASAEGCASAEQKFSVGEAEVRAITLNLEKAGGAASAPLPSPATGPSEAPTTPREEAPEERANGSTWRNVGLAGAGLGLVGIGVGVVFGLKAAGKQSDANCPDNRCPNEQAASTLRDAQSAGTVSTIAFAAGAVLAAGGIALYFVAPRGSGATGASARLAPAVGLHGAGLVLEGGAF